eukprot:4725583-Amphidinium_carterae.1
MHVRQYLKYKTKQLTPVPFSRLRLLLAGRFLSLVMPPSLCKLEDANFAVAAGRLPTPIVTFASNNSLM